MIAQHLNRFVSRPCARGATDDQGKLRQLAQITPRRAGSNNQAAMLREAQKSVSDWAIETGAMANNGEIGNGRSSPVVNRATSYGSTNADYLSARIARDRPDILERMKAGEFSSVRQAACPHFN